MCALFSRLSLLLCCYVYLQGRPLFFTFFLSNDVKLHPTDATRATEVLQRHCHGGKDALINPPFSAQRLAELGADLVEHSFEVSQRYCGCALVSLVLTIATNCFVS